jgi:hypothetical protein
VIDPLAAIIALMRTSSPLTALVGSRISTEHQFGTPAQPNAWPTPSNAVVVTYDQGGFPDIHTATQQPRLVVRCYGEDELGAARVYGAVIELSRASDRRLVTTPMGQGLIYWFTADGTPFTLRDLDVNSIPLIQCFFWARVAEQPVSP